MVIRQTACSELDCQIGWSAACEGFCLIAVSCPSHGSSVTAPACVTPRFANIMAHIRNFFIHFVLSVTAAHLWLTVDAHPVGVSDGAHTNTSDNPAIEQALTTNFEQTSNHSGHGLPTRRRWRCTAAEIPAESLMVGYQPPGEGDISYTTESLP